MPRHRHEDADESVLSGCPSIRDAWEVRKWTEKDAYGTSVEGVSIYRHGVLIAEGPLHGSPYRRARRYIPRGLISDALRAKFQRPSK